MNLKNLSAEGYTAFVLAIIFTIVSLASMIYFIRNKQTSKTITILTTMVFPTLAIFCWVYLILNVYEMNILTALYIALGASIGYLLLSLVVAITAVAIIKAKQNKQNQVAQTEEQAESTEEVSEMADISVKEVAEEISEEVSEEVSDDSIIVTPLMITPPEEEVVEEVQVEEVSEETKTSDEDAEQTEQGVIFSTTTKKTFAEAISLLDEEKFGFYKEILEYAQSQAKTKTKEAKYHQTVSVGRMKLVQFKFIREALVASFMGGSSELKNYSAKEKAVKIKEKPILIDVENTESVVVAKNMIDIVYKNIMDAKIEKHSKDTIPTVSEILTENSQNIETETSSETQNEETSNTENNEE